MTWRILLWPFSLVYGLVTAIRNWAFSRGILKSQAFKLPVILVGNLSTGGTGKTPMTEFILEKVKSNKPVMVSRGYGRHTKGLVEAHELIIANEVGDEPFQIHRKFPNTQVIVSEKRVLGIERAIGKYNADLIVLDDAFQHRYVQASYQILLTTYSNPYFRDYVLPAGNLREFRSGRKRADMVVVTKCPEDLDLNEAERIEAKLKLNDKPVFFSSLNYEQARNHKGEIINDKSLVNVVVGIAKPEPFLAKVESLFENIGDVRIFPDHHSFTERNIEDIKSYIDDKGMVLCSEKDWVRLIPSLDEEHLDHVYYLPIKMKILFNQEGNLLTLLNQHIQNFDTQS